jgi:hypothetical protein
MAENSTKLGGMQIDGDKKEIWILDKDFIMTAIKV